VATRNRPEQLDGCLRSLRDLAYRDVDVVVVDNAPSDDRTRDAVAAFDGAPGWLTYVREPRPGLSAARNAGIRAAQGEIVAFADDDTRAAPCWLSAMVQGFGRHPDVRWVTGVVQPAQLDWPSQILFERAFGWGSRSLEPYLFDIGAHPAPDRLHPYAFSHLGGGANAAVRRDTLAEVGDFDEALGVGTPSLGGEDLDYALRIIRAGHVIAYEPAAIMWHYHRTEDAALRRQIYGYGVGLGAFITKLIAQRETRGDVVRRIPLAVRHYVSGQSSKNRHKSAGYPTSLIVRELVGLVNGPGAYGRSVRRRRRMNGG
jgi:GT2 family glycosyltransferase